MPGWLTLILGVVIGALIPLVGNWIRDRKEIEEKYKLALYAKRLEAHQRAFFYIQKLSRVLNDAERENSGELIREAREWWDSSCLYLDETSRKEMIPAINSAADYIIPGREKHGDSLPVSSFIRQLNKTEKAIVTGIGMKHLDIPSKQEENRSE